MTSPENDYLGTKVQDETLVDRLTTRAMIRRCSINRKSYKDRKPDNIAELLEEAAVQLAEYEKQTQELQDLISEYKDDWNDLGYRDVWHKGYMAGALAAEAEYINKLEALQAKLDRLMFEYCPEDMTKEQVNKWGKHQVVFKE